MNFDLSNFDTSADGEWLQLRHPVTHEPLEGVQIRMVGPDSDEFREASRRNTDRRLRMKAGRGTKITAEDLEHDALEVLVSCIKGWSGMVQNGQVMDFNPIAAREVLGKYVWIREQVDSFISDRANFIKA